MTRVEWARVRPLLARLWELPEQEHAAFLQEACAGDEQLARRAREMFRRERDEASFLESPLASTAGVEAGNRLGPYRLLRELGSGGMGAVWLAERDDGAFRKQVAVKLLKSGLHTDDVLQRFRNERQVLAWLDHPGIARLVDGGRSEQGLPYLVMEHVDGTPIDRACDEQMLSIEARLELFLTVCDAVQHAHERGVVHRDLKPSNILVDNDGRARLLDFGIAKVLGAESEQDLADLTRTGQRLYSPHYAAPEQVRGEDVTAASDVYSLGVLLFELLTGRRPYHVLSVSQFELERVVCEEEPLRPSTSTGTAVRESGDEASWRSRGFEDEHGLRRRLGGDLDWILLTALRKEPERRYASVAALAADVRRHLQGRPVEARPESAAYRASRFVRRHRVLVGSFTAVLLVVTGALVVALTLLSQTQRAEARQRLEAYAAGLQSAEGALRTNDLAQAEAALVRAPEELRGWEWRHLSGRLDRSARAFDLSVHQVLDRIACDAQGRWLVANTGLDVVDPLAGPVRGVRIDASSTKRAGGTAHASPHPGGDVLAVVTHGHRALILDAGSLTTLHELDEEAVRGVEFSRAGDLLVIVRDDGEAVLLAWPSLEERARWATGVDRPYYARFAPDGRHVAFAGWDEAVRLWRIDGQAPELERVLAGHAMEIRSLAFDPTGAQLASGSLDRTVRIWPLASPEAAPLVFRQHATSVDAVLFHPFDGTVVSKDMNGEILRWDPESGAIRNRIRTRGLGAVGLSRDGEWIASSRVRVDENMHRLLVWPLSSQDVRTLEGCEFSNAVAFSPDGTTLFCSAPDGRIRRWDRAGRAAPALRIDDEPLVMSQDLHAGHVVAWHESGRITRWDLEGNHVSTFDSEYRPRAGSGLSIHGERVALCAEVRGESRVAVLDLDAGSLEAETSCEGSDVRRAVWTAQGDELLVLGQDALWSWRPAGAPEPRRLASLPMPGACAALEPGGTRLLVASTLRSAIRMVDARTGEVVQVGEPGTGCSSVAWHPHEPRFAVGYSDGSTGIWDSERLRELVRLRGHEGAVRALAFSRDGELLASCGDDGWVKVWDAPAAR